MRNTVSAPIVKEERSNELEWTSLVNATKRALDQRYEATFTLATAATGVMTTVWTSDALPLSSAWEVHAVVLGRATAGGSGRARLVLEALFYRDAAGAVQEGATLAAVTIRSVAALSAQFAVSGNSILLQVQDDAVLTMSWSAMVTNREVTV